MSSLTKPLARYSHARKVGHLLYLAGQGSRDPATDSYPTGVTAHTQGVLANIERVLKSNGLDRSALVDVNVFLVDMGDFDAMNAVWNEFFAEVATPPTRTTVAVKQLPGKNVVEMKAIATWP